VNDPAPTREKYQGAFNALSKAIDEVRGVYLNVGESAANVGLFPYEPLHDMRKALLAYGVMPTPGESDRQECGAKINQAWFALRPQFLYELQPRRATYPITESGATDPRRGGGCLPMLYESPVEMYVSSVVAAVLALPRRLSSVPERGGPQTRVGGP
jgi:hypothetical protein